MIGGPDEQAEVAGRGHAGQRGPGVAARRGGAEDQRDDRPTGRHRARGRRRGRRPGTPASSETAIAPAGEQRRRGARAPPGRGARSGGRRSAGRTPSPPRTRRRRARRPRRRRRSRRRCTALQSIAAPSANSAARTRAPRSAQRLPPWRGPPRRHRGTAPGRRAVGDQAPRETHPTTIAAAPTTRKLAHRADVGGRGERAPSPAPIEPAEAERRVHRGEDRAAGARSTSTPCAFMRTSSDPLARPSRNVATTTRASVGIDRGQDEPARQGRRPRSARRSRCRGGRPRGRRPASRSARPPRARRARAPARPGRRPAGPGSPGCARPTCRAGRR